MSALDFFSALDVDDDVNELLEHHAGVRSSASSSSTAAANAAAASTSARDILSRIMQHQQQHRAQQQSAAAAAASTHRAANNLNNLVDGLMNDDWNTGSGESLFDDAVMGAVGSPDHPAVPLMPPPPGPGPPRPVTTADLAAAFWNGHARGAMSAAAASGAVVHVPSNNNGGLRAGSAASSSMANPFASLGASLGVSATHTIMPAIPSSATALTANLATANALANTEALNAQLLQHWLTNDTTGMGMGMSSPSSRSTAPGIVGNTTSSPWDPSPMPMASFPTFGAAMDQPSMTSNHLSGLAELTSPSSLANATNASAQQSYLEQLLALDQASSVQQTGMPFLSDALSSAASVANRSRRDLNTASSLLESRLQLARANAMNISNAGFGGVGSGSAATSTANHNGSTAQNNNNGNTSHLFSNLLDFDHFDIDQFEGGNNDHGDDDTIGTVDPCDSDDEDGMPALEDIIMPPATRQVDANGGSTGGRGACAHASAPAAASTSYMPASSSNTATESTSNGNGRSTENSAALTAATVDTPAFLPRRSRRQAAVRGLERISTALATHGMGGGGPYSEEGTARSVKVKTEASKPATKPKAASKKKPTIIPKPGSKRAAEQMKKEEPPPTCCICLEEPSKDELCTIHVCVHPFCFTCIEKWADQENSCPLCKARFFKIDKVHKPKKRKAGSAEGGLGSDCGRNSKRVRNRDQRSDVNSFVNPIEGIFASMEANGTWPTHIAQLLFSGLGASSLGGGGPNRASAARFTSNMPSAAAFGATVRRQQHRQQAAASASANSRSSLGFRYQPPPPPGPPSRPSGGGGLFRQVRGQTNFGPAGSPFLSSVPTATRTGGPNLTSVRESPFGGPLPSPPQMPQQQQPTMRTTTTMASTTSGNADRNPFSLEPSSPWSASASVSVTLGPQGFAGRSLSTRTTSFQTFPNPGSGSNGGSSSRTSAMDNTTGSLFLTGEEEDLLSLSPSSYIRRLHRELEGGSSNTMRQDGRSSGQYQFNTSARRSSLASRAAPSPSDNPFSMFSAAPMAAPSYGGAGRSQRNRGNHYANRNAAGRTMETALEVGLESSDDDDDVVEVIDVEALI